MAEKSSSQKTLEEAIRFEVEGRDFFLKAADQTKNYFAKLIFQVIAEDELDHIERVKKIYERLLQSEKQEPTPPVPKISRLENVFRQAKAQMDSKAILNTDETEAIRLAVQLESKGHEFYKRLAEEATRPFEKTFYQQLAQEESVHFSVLREMEEAIMSRTTFG